jgi:hypothetical protein
MQLGARRHAFGRACGGRPPWSEGTARAGRRQSWELASGQHQDGDVDDDDDIGTLLGVVPMSTYQDAPLICTAGTLRT